MAEFTLKVQRRTTHTASVKVKAKDYKEAVQIVTNAEIMIPEENWAFDGQQYRVEKPKT